METDKIDYRFKILYALSIIMVVYGHCSGGGSSLFSDWFPVYGLHLAIFTFCSGYFYKPSSEQNVGFYIRKKVKSLILPLYIYNFVYALLAKLLTYGGFSIGKEINLKNLFLMPLIDGHQFLYNMGGWFIAPLFMLEIYNILLRRVIRALKIRVPEWMFFFFHLFLGIIGAKLAASGYAAHWQWLVLIRVSYFLPFYSMGIWYKSSLEKYDSKISGIWYFSFIFLAKIVIGCIYNEMPSYTISWCNDFTEGPFMPFITGFLGVAFWLRIAAIAEPAIGRNKYVNLIADSTYSIMMNQFMGFMIVKSIFAALSRWTPYFSDFDWVNYKTSIWYYYIPNDLPYIFILYQAAGIVFPIFVQFLINRLKKAPYPAAIQSH